MSVYEKANLLEDHASRIADGEDSQRQATRVSSRLLELRSQLNQLRSQLAVTQALQSRGAGLDIDLSGIDDGRAGFERSLGPSGLPSNQVFNTAKKKTQAVTDRLAEENQAAWSAWTEQLLADLPLARISMLVELEAEKQASRRQLELERIARGKASKEDITTFATTYAGLAELLQDTQDPPEALVDLLNRLREQPGLTLSDVTDEEIALLRECRMDAHITLKRKGS
ncbi:MULTISPECIES: hypothetical protein [Streptomyces]|uniref:hypothetical protein n=1 Tax=Streptomyces TaxID=1883 RepID=UPI00056BF855|nr:MULTISPECIES: hypothetical protein [Streptomyces]MBZ6111170.1 hypothetical protein [Streptomyces olivaceus]MBZ6127730.1 hypothetical protein [Streptomyces olivaceus]MBZ6145506.1 hypothetical protein [Streptomyces olivaceus]MBZ6159488.1 hypothetical protein [Streptomyces olivaceus]MBZ6187265.1 hypothetical protein [Streptomyces olivaceus]